jgi:hypothetical protein
MRRDGIFANDRYGYCILDRWNLPPRFNGGVNPRGRLSAHPRSNPAQGLRVA